VHASYSSWAMLNATVVVAACNEPLAWVDSLLQHDRSVRGVIIEQCNPLRVASHPRMQVEIAPRCGREASSYLFFLVHHWDRLPVHTFFVQADLPEHWHAAAAMVPGTVHQHLEQSLKVLAGSAASVAFFAGGFSSSSCQTANSAGGLGQIWGLLQRYSGSSGYSPMPPRTTSVMRAHFYLHRDRLVRAKLPRVMFAELLRLFDYPANHTHECDLAHQVGYNADPHIYSHPGWLLPTSFERLWPTIWGCSELLRAEPQDDDKACKSYRNRTQRCLVEGEVSCFGCSEWHRALGVGAST
jgi:hypothetical protein